MAASMAGKITFEQKVKAAAWGAVFAWVEISCMFQDHVGKDHPRQNNDTENKVFLKLIILQTIAQGQMAENRPIPTKTGENVLQLAG